MHPALERTAHRPYPLPRGLWLGRMTWHDVLFAHWPVRAAKIRKYVPEPLVLQEFGGSCWIGVVPFRMTIRFRGVPPLPWLSAFAEINVRTYVEYGGVPGVWFFSLNTDRRPAVWASKRFR